MPLIKPSCNRLHAVLQSFLLFADFVLECLFVYTDCYWAYINGFILLIVALTGLLASCTDPGYLRPSQKYSFN